MKGASATNLSYKEFSLDISKGKIPPNLVLASKYKIVTSILLKSIAQKFLEEEKITEETLKY